MSTPIKLRFSAQSPAVLVGCRIIIQACGLVLLLIAARILGKEDIGAFALASSVVVLATRITEAGWSEQATASPQLAEPPSAIFWGGIITGVVMTLLVLIVVLILSAIHTNENVRTTCFILSFTIIPTVFTSCQSGVLIRDRRLLSLSGLQATAELTGTLVSSLLLLSSANIVALAYGRLTTSLLAAALAGLAVRWIPRPKFDLISLWESYKFSAKLVASRLISFLASYGAEFLIAAFLGLKEVGIYRIASRIAGALAEIFNEPLRVISWSNITHASSLPNRIIEIPKAITAVQSSTLIFGIPAFLLLATNASDIINLLLGRADWIEVAPVISILCVAKVLGLPTIVTEPTFTVSEHTWWIPRLTAIGATVSTALTIIAGIIFHDVKLIAISQVISSITVFCIVELLLWILIDLHPIGLAKSMITPIISAVISLAVMIGLRSIFYLLEFEGRVTILVLSVFIGIISYASCARREIKLAYRSFIIRENISG